MSGTKFLGIPSRERVISTVIEVAQDAASAAAGAGSVIVAQKLNGFFGLYPATEIAETLTQNATWICEGMSLLKTSALEGALPGVGGVALTTLFVYMAILAGINACGEKAKYQRIREPGEGGDATADPTLRQAICGKPSEKTVKTGAWYVGKNTLFAAAGAGTVLGAQAISGAFKTKEAIQVGSDFVCSGIDLLKVTLAIALSSGVGGSALLALLGTVLVAAWAARGNAPAGSNPGFDEEGLSTPREKSRCCP